MISFTPFAKQQPLSEHMDLIIYGLAQERRDSSVLAMDLRLSCTNPSIRPSYTTGCKYNRSRLAWNLMYIGWNKRLCLVKPWCPGRSNYRDVREIWTIAEHVGCVQKYAASSPVVVFCCRMVLAGFTPILKISSLAMDLSYHYPSAREATPKDIGRYIMRVL